MGLHLQRNLLANLRIRYHFNVINEPLQRRGSMTIKMTESLTGIQTEREDRHTSVICPRQNRCLPLFPNKRIHFLTQNPKAGLDCTLCGTLQGRVTVDSKVQEGGRQPTRDISCLKLKQILILSKLRHLI